MEDDEKISLELKTVIVSLTIRKDYHFDVEVSAELVNGSVLYHCKLLESAFISHFDQHKVFTAESIEKSLAKIAEGLDKAIAVLRDEV